MPSGTRSVPTTRLHCFNMKLVKLYSRHECLWNINHEQFLDGVAQARIWKVIALELDPQGDITPEFCRKRIQDLRHWESLHRLKKIRASASKRGTKYYTPLSHWRQRQGEAYYFKMSTADTERDVAMSFSQGKQKSLELLPEGCYEHAFDFLNKIFSEDDREEENSQ